MSYKLLRQFTVHRENLINRIYGYHGHDQKRCLGTFQTIKMMHESFPFTMHEGLPREGPGSTACTKKMFSFLPGLPEYPAILDIGCGSGMQTIDIARLCPKARITAVDVYPAFLEEVKTNAYEQLDFPIVSGLYRHQWMSCRFPPHVSI